MLCYCKKCGRVVQEVYGRDKQICDYCNSTLEYIPKQFLIKEVILNDDLKQQFIDEYIKSSPEFDQYLFDHRDEDLAQRRMENRRKLEHGKAILEGKDKGNPYGIICPYCKATNIRKIGIVSRSVSAGIFGLGSKKIGKQWHCDHCGSDF